MLYEKLQELVKNDTIQIFGSTGSGKTTFALQLVKEMVANKKRVLYIDTEKNLLEQPPGCDYQYYPNFDKMAEYIKDLKKKYDLVVLDSLGLPILGKYAWLSAREKGDILAKCSAISYSLKNYCHDNEAMALVLNQPESEFNKSMYHVLRSFGDKAQFFYKEIWKTRITKQEPTLTTCVVESFRSRFSGRKTPLFQIAITSKGVRVEALE